MKKLLSLLLVLMMLLAVPSVALASSSDDGGHADRISAMQKEAKRLAGRTFNGALWKLFQIGNGCTAYTWQEVTNQAAFISRLLNVAGLIEDKITLKMLYAMTAKTDALQNGVLLFSVGSRGPSRVGIYFDGYQYSIWLSNKVRCEKYSAKTWNYIGVVNGL